jgi:hypothetical protein
MYPQQKSYRCDETLITTPKIERIKKKNVSMGVNSNFFIKEIALTTEGLYAKLISGSKEQPIMISWTGKVLKKKQGVVFWKLEE